MKPEFEQLEDLCLCLGEQTEDELRKAELRNIHGAIRMITYLQERGHEYDDIIENVRLRLEFLIANPESAGWHEAHRQARIKDDGLD